MVTIEQARDYIGVDYDDNLVGTLVETSLAYIDSMVGEAYKSDEKAVKLVDLLQLKLIADMYDNRSTEVSSKSRQDRITLSILDKLCNFEEGEN